MNVILSGLKERLKELLYKLTENNLSWSHNWTEDCKFALKVFVVDNKQMAEIIIFVPDEVQKERRINSLYNEYLGSKCDVLLEAWVKPEKGKPRHEYDLFIN